jgi:hypothetical protein
MLGSGAFGGDVVQEPAVSGHHLATSSASGSARMARTLIATQWDTLTP